MAYRLREERSDVIAERLGFKTPDAVRMASRRVLKMIKAEITKRLGLQEPSAQVLRMIKEEIARLRGDEA